MIKGKNILIGMTIITIGFGGVYFVRKSQDKSTLVYNFQTVQIDYVNRSNIEKYRKFSGSVKGLQEEALSPTMPSNVLSINVKKGDAVKKDQVLMVLDSSSVDEQVCAAKDAYEKALSSKNSASNQLSQAQNQISQLDNNIKNEKSNLNSLQDDLKKSKNDLEKLKNDLESNEISQLEFQTKSLEISKKVESISGKIQESSSKLGALEIQKSSIKNGLSSFNTSSIDTQINQLKKVYDSALEAKESYTLKAPFDGYVTSLNATVGKPTLGLNPPIVISNTSELSLEINVSDKDIGLIKVGDEYKVSIEDKSGKNVDTTGKVSSIESVVENDIKSNLVKLTLPNKEKLSSGSFAQVYIPNTKREDTLVISKNALFRNGDTPYVYIVTPEDKVKKVNVSLGIENDDYIEVLSGLREGHKVITKGKEFVSIDEKVNIVGGVEK